MVIEPADIQRLARFQRTPGEFIDRRSELVEFIGRQRYSVTIVVQFTVPTLTDTDGQEEKPILVPLGNFTKARRVDLTVRGADGTLLATPLRQNRADLLAVLFIDSWKDRLIPLAPTAKIASDENEGLLRGAITRSVLSAVISVVASPEELAYAYIDRLLNVLSRTARALPKESVLRRDIDALLGADTFWDELASLARTTTLLAELFGRPGSTYVLEARYSDRLEYKNIRRLSIRPWLRVALPWLGLTSYSIRRQVANSGRSASLWIATSMPPGVEILRYFWDDLRDEPTDTTKLDPARPEDAVVQGSDAIIGSIRRSEDQSNELVLDAQIMSSAGVFTAFWLSLLMLFISTYIFQDLPKLQDDSGTRDSVLAIAGLFAAAPAAIAGALALQGQAFARHVSRGPRTLVAGLSGVSAFLAVVIALKQIGALAKWLAYGTSLYAMLLIGIFFFILVGPRWRKSELSRWKSRTKSCSPSLCQSRQTHEAIAWMVFWLASLVVFARCQLVLQQQHFFSHGFPGNIWRAWWSWF